MAILFRLKRIKLMCHARILEKDFKVYTTINEIPDNSLDVITMFHVLEHLADPVEILELLYDKLLDGGKLIIEVPSSTDALLNLYECREFAEFSYWSCHLYLFNQETLENLLKKTGYRLVSLRQYQRYTLANHLHWLAKGKPGGHIEWGFLDSEEIQAAYEKQLAETGQCDSLLAVIEK
jgi:SAM-dependent methyltransferase